jgi:hypothetical protein
MHITHLRKVGGSVMLAVPPEKRRRYTLEKLLAQCNPKAKRTKADREWVDSKPAGCEKI